MPKLVDADNFIQNSPASQDNHPVRLGEAKLSSPAIAGVPVGGSAGLPTGLTPSQATAHLPAATASNDGKMTAAQADKLEQFSAESAYVRLGGRAGGQILYLGQNTGDDGEIHSNPSKDGLIKLGDNSAYNENNGRLGLGTLTPQTSLEVRTGEILASNFPNTNGAEGVMVRGGININGYSTLGTYIATVVESAGGNSYGMKFYTRKNFSTGQTSKLYIKANGDIAIGDGLLDPTARLHVKGPTADSSVVVLKLNDINGGNLLSVRGDGGYAFKGGTIGPAQTGYSMINYTATRSIIADVATLPDAINFLCTLADDLRTKGIISA